MQRADKLLAKCHTFEDNLKRVNAFLVVSNAVLESIQNEDDMLIYKESLTLLASTFIGINYDLLEETEQFRRGNS